MSQAWFDSLSKKAQIIYLRKHPNSKYGRKKVKNPPVNVPLKVIIKAHKKGVKFDKEADVKKWMLKARRLKAQLDAAKTDSTKNRLEAKYNIAKRRYENLRSIFKG